MSAPRAAVRVVGLGQRAAGDDGAGLAVLAELRRGGAPEDAELCEAPEPFALVERLCGVARVIVVDAVLARPPGAVLVLEPEALAERLPVGLSSHGFGVRQAIELARATDPEGCAREIRVVAVAIERPSAFRDGLSAPVAAGVIAAAARVRELLTERAPR